MRAPEGPGWLRDLYPSKRVYREPLICGSSVNIRNERDEDLALEEAVDGLRALKNEVRFGDLGTPVRDESGEFDSLRDEILAQTDDDLPDIVRKPPLPIKHDRYLRKIDGDNFPDLMKKLNDPSAREPSPEPIVRTYPNHSRWYPEEITIRDANPFCAGRFDAKATPALPTVTVKDEFEDMPGLETPPDLSHSSHLEPYKVISMSESISDDDKASNDGKVATSKLENMVEDDKDVVIVESPEPVVKETKESLTRIATNLDFVVPEMEGMDTEEVQAIILAMGRLGLLQVVNDLAEVKERGLVLEPVYWQTRVADAMKQKDQFDRQMEDADEEQTEGAKKKGDEMDDECIPCKTLLFVRKVKDEDIDMDTHLDDKPDAQPITVHTTTPVDWYPDTDVPPYVPASPPINYDMAYAPKSPELSELDEIRVRISELEDTVEASKVELKDRVAQLEAQMFADGCMLTELKWKQEELKKVENKQWSNRKKTNRRLAPNPPSHRYPTRYATSMVDENWKETQRQMTGILERIQALEERVAVTRSEIDRLKSEIAEALALAPKVEELAKTVDAHLKEQADTNSVLLSEIAMFRNTITPELRAQIKQQTINIANLTNSFRQLYSFASALLYPTQASGFGTYSNYPSTFPSNPVPERKTISVF